MSILQFQVRKKLLELLQQWRSAGEGREFAFIHLFMNLKDRENTPRVPSEYISGIARIRTDLVQFSFIERESLMYHGYTLIDSQIRLYCSKFHDGMCGHHPIESPPLFRDSAASDSNLSEKDLTDRRQKIKNVLTTGSQKVFLLRSISKHGAKAAFVLGLGCPPGSLLLPLDQ